MKRGKRRRALGPIGAREREEEVRRSMGDGEREGEREERKRKEWKA